MKNERLAKQILNFKLNEKETQEEKKGVGILLICGSGAQ
jgi:hypothetical protein